jgi:hypothetical protein
MKGKRVAILTISLILHFLIVRAQQLAVGTVFPDENSNCISSNSTVTSGNYIHHDTPFIQDYSIKYFIEADNLHLLNVASDRNGYIQVFSSAGLLRPRSGQFLFPGTLVRDVQYKPTSDKKIAGTGVYKNQLVYIDDQAVFSNAWAGRLFLKHGMPAACIFAGGNNFTFLISDGKELKLLEENKTLWKGMAPVKVKDIQFDKGNNLFWILTKGTVWSFSPEKKKLEQALTFPDITFFEIAGKRLVIGTPDGYAEFDTKTKKQLGDIHRKLPCTHITAISEIDGHLWFGSPEGAFMLRDDGKFNYYASERWLPSGKVIKIAKGPEHSVLILTGKGLAKICFEKMTLAEKAAFFEKQVSERHIRNGFNAALTRMSKGDVTSGSLTDSDNDGLWTSMYLAAEAFRYAVTRSDEALQNIRELLDAMERLYTINPVPGFPSRSFERRGYKYDSEPWRRAGDPEWDWKSTTSSDEAIGHIFVYGVIAELVDVPELHTQAVSLIDTLMSHIVKNDFYLVDWNGKPTLWGRWNPEYVNARPEMVGDRKINSSNIIGMLQTAYHFTGKEKYKKAAFGLMEKHGYLENLMRPMEEIGPAPEEADDWSKMLSEAWNHSDDEMYYCGYWGLYRYAFNDTLKTMYRKAIIDHWEIERPEKEGLWNIMTAITGPGDFDFKEAIWYLQEYPLDLINWTVTNSNRNDIVPVDENFRMQTIAEVLPPDELPVRRHNANRFGLDGGSNGHEEESAGDIWLLPYWMGRYLGIIGEATGK